MHSELIGLPEAFKDRMVFCVPVQSKTEAAPKPWQYNERVMIENLRQRADLTVARYGFPLYGCGRLKRLRP